MMDKAGKCETGCPSHVTNTKFCETLVDTIPSALFFKNSEKTVRKREEHLSQIVEGNSIPTFVIDRNHFITHWNKACERLTGIPATAIIGTKNQWQAFYSENRPVLADLIVDSASSSKIVLNYGELWHPSEYIQGAIEVEDFFPDFGENGKWLFFTAAPLKDSNGNIIGAIETLQDITKRKTAEERLLQSEKRYRLLTENVADGVGIVQNNRFVFANKALEEILGLNAEKILTTNPRDLLHGEHKIAYDHLIVSIKEGIKTDRFLAPYNRQNKENLWLEARLNMIDWEEKDAILVTIRDITESKLREESLKEESKNLRRENVKLKSAIKDRFRMGDIIGKSSSMQEVYELILKGAKTDASVIITGESGTGKELVAHAIHEISSRSKMSFVPVNCGAIPDKLLESEFFGFKKGAFSGATANKHGYLDLADEGTLFLDELGELEYTMQVKLLRAIDGGGYFPIGSNTPSHSDFRIIAATNRNLKALVKKGLMREDFFFRIHVIPIELPPLRNRKEDIPLLIEHFLASNGHDPDITLIPGKYLEKMYRYDWPGNVRELQNVLKQYLTTQKIEFIHDSLKIPENIAPEPIPMDMSSKNPTLQKTIGAIEKNLVEKALQETKWNRTKAAELLGISRRALFRKIKNFEMA